MFVVLFVDAGGWQNCVVSPPFGPHMYTGFVWFLTTHVTVCSSPLHV